MCAKGFIFVVLTSFVLIQAEDVNQTLIDYYIQLIENHTLSAQNYQLPNDARIYEPENNTIQGMVVYLVMLMVLQCALRSIKINNANV